MVGVKRFIVILLSAYMALLGPLGHGAAAGNEHPMAAVGPEGMFGSQETAFIGHHSPKADFLDSACDIACMYFAPSEFRFVDVQLAERHDIALPTASVPGYRGFDPPPPRA